MHHQHQYEEESQVVNREDGSAVRITLQVDKCPECGITETRTCEIVPEIDPWYKQLGLPADILTLSENERMHLLHGAFGDHV